MKKASLTEKIINDYADVIKWGAGQVVDTYQEIDLYLFRGRNLDEKRKNLLLVLDMLDDDIEVIRKMQADVRKALAVEEILSRAAFSRLQS